MTQIRGETQDIINVYRSAGASSSQFVTDLKETFDNTKRTLIVGDLNICFQAERSHSVLKAVAELGFKQRVVRATHSGGRQIDHAFIFFPEQMGVSGVEVVQESPYFTDHDILFITEIMLDFFFLTVLNKY